MLVIKDLYSDISDCFWLFYGSKYRFNTFEFMIPPYNPLVVGRVTQQTESTLRCDSSDGRRTFVFHYNGAKKASCLDYIEMYRNDKGDMVSYHKD